MKSCTEWDQGDYSLSLTETANDAHTCGLENAPLEVEPNNDLLQATDLGAAGDWENGAIETSGTIDFIDPNLGAAATERLPNESTDMDYYKFTPSKCGMIRIAASPDPAPGETPASQLVPEVFLGYDDSYEGFVALARGLPAEGSTEARIEHLMTGEEPHYVLLLNRSHCLNLGGKCYGYSLSVTQEQPTPTPVPFDFSEPRRTSWTTRPPSVPSPRPRSRTTPRQRRPTWANRR